MPKWFHFPQFCKSSKEAMPKWSHFQLFFIKNNLVNVLMIGCVVLLSDFLLYGSDVEYIKPWVEKM